ncbi:hypothetical protein [Brucella intermedia]|uniref:hypothetical protein n=1 Tax=Brucella intermedia TaxID=94625 RepID=UPI00124D9123|nr:hypothetical protein [Brucella intermedia]KAB2722415.1 hypothetical protein F9L02_22680 [Brucella intermedia]
MVTSHPDPIDVMGWKQQLRASDISETEKLEARCRVFGHVHYLTRAILCADAESSQRYIDEVEAQTTCRARGCKGRVRLSKVRLDELSRFVDGLA